MSKYTEEQLVKLEERHKRDTLGLKVSLAEEIPGLVSGVRELQAKNARLREVAEAAQIALAVIPERGAAKQIRDGLVTALHATREEKT